MVWDFKGNSGPIDLPRMMTIVVDAGYHGYCGIEHGDAGRELDSIRELRQQLEATRDQLAASSPPIRVSDDSVAEGDNGHEEPDREQSMKTRRRNRPQRTITRREFVGGALATGVLVAGAPALLRGRNLNDKLNIAFIGSGGRANTNIRELTMLPGQKPPRRRAAGSARRAASGRERHRPLRRQPAGDRRRGREVPEGEDLHGSAEDLR